MTEQVEIEALVAAIVDDYQIALNKGENDGVVEDAEVELFRVVDVKDPETREALGSVSVVKLRLRVSQVKERMCVAQVVQRATGNPLNRMLGIGTQPLLRVRSASGRGLEGVVEIEVGERAVITVEHEEPPF